MSNSIYGFSSGSHIEYTRLICFNLLLGVYVYVYVYVYVCGYVDHNLWNLNWFDITIAKINCINEALNRTIIQMMMITIIDFSFAHIFYRFERIVKKIIIQKYRLQWFKMFFFLLWFGYCCRSFCSKCEI